MASELNREEKRQAQRSRLSPAQQARLELRLRGSGTADAKLNSIPRRAALASPPLSFAQQRLWFLQQLEPDNPYYNEHAALKLTGTLDVEVLEQSLNAIVRRHEALRTTFEEGGFEEGAGRPVQVITPSLSLPLSKVDLRHQSESAQKREMQRLSVDQSQRPFNLAQGPLLRWMLIQLDERNQALLFTVHHIIFDGWSIDILMRELSAFYTSFSTTRTNSQAIIPPPELPIQYADYAVWQLRQLQGEALQSQLDYWRQRLEQAPPLLQLPSDRPRPSIQTYRGATQSFQLSTPLTQALKHLSRDAGATLFMTLLTAFKILLYRYTGQTDLIVGSPVANRNRSEVEGLIGVFVNSLVLRTDLSGDPTVEALLGRIRQVMLGAYAHQDLPFEKVVEDIKPERNAHYNPLFQVSFTLHNTPRRSFELPGLTITPLAVKRDRALLDLRLDITETEEGLTGCWEYNTDLFDGDRICRMSGHFQTLLEAIVSHPQQRLSELPVLTAAEHQQMLQWNQTQTDYPQTHSRISHTISMNGANHIFWRHFFENSLKLSRLDPKNVQNWLDNRQDQPENQGFGEIWQVNQ